MCPMPHFRLAEVFLLRVMHQGLSSFQGKRFAPFLYIRFRSHSTGNKCNKTDFLRAPPQKHPPSFVDFFFSVQWEFGLILMCCRWNATVLPDESGRVPWRVTQKRGCFDGPAAARRRFGALRAAVVATAATWSTYGQGW